MSELFAREEEEQAELIRHGAAIAGLLGLAIGDAYSSSDRKRISELTQLALAGAEGLIRGTIRSRNGKQLMPGAQYCTTSGN